MAFDTRIEEHMRLEFQANFEIALQQMGSKLRPYVNEKPCRGEGAVAVDLIDAVVARRRTVSPSPNPSNPASRRRRWLVYQDPLETGEYITTEDRLRQIESPDSDLMMVHAAAVGRGIDDIILGLDENGAVASGGLLGVVVEGKRPGGAGVALPSKHITVHGSAGLTIDKLRAARKQLGLDENDLDRMSPVMAITPRQNDDLLGIVASGSANYNQLEQPHIVQGKVQRLLGFTFLQTNRLPKSGTTRSCPVWIKEHVVLGVWQDVRTRMWNDSSRRNEPYAHVDAIMDCTRRQDEGVHVIECTES